MSKEFYMRVIVAGRYRKVVRYTRALPRDSQRVRSEKRQVTNTAQRYINIKTSTENLQWLLCANFDRKDACFCTFNFDESHLPATRKEAKQLVAECFQKIRREFVKHEREFKSIYTVEGEAQTTVRLADPSDVMWEITPWKDKSRWDMVDTDNTESSPNIPVRLHAHGFLLLNYDDYDVVRSFWPYGHVYINRMRVNDPASFGKLASYVMKDVRNNKRPSNERGYVPSLNLAKPIVDGWWCNEFEGISVPKTALLIEHQPLTSNMYGAAEEHAFYRLPREEQLPRPYKSKGSLSKKSLKCSKR